MSYPPPLKPGFARDQYGEPWIIVARSDSLWAVGLDDDGAPIIRFIAGDGFTIKLEIPRAIRLVTNVNEQKPQE